MSTEKNQVVETTTEIAAVKKTATKKVTKPKAATNTATETVASAPAKPKKSPAQKTVTAPKIESNVTNVESGESAKNVIPTKSPVSAEERHQMIATAAYFLAHNRGFNGNYEMQDWMTAEAQIDQQLKTAE